jgi:Domain of unknown function (DUF4136)
MIRSARFPWAAAIAAIALLAGMAVLVAAKIDIEVHRAKNANFEVIKTYTWLPSPPPTTDVAPGLMRDPKVVQQELDPIIVGAVDAEFRKRGLQRVADGGDVQVVYYLSHGTSINASTMGSYYQYAADFYVGGVYGGQTTYVKVIEEGSLVVDVVDDRRAIWRAQASAKINRENDDAKRRKLIEEAVAKMFAKYPKK